VSSWVRLAARLLLAGVWLVAGGSKVGDLAASVRAVHAYDILPYDASRVVGATLPFIEIAVGLLLLVGFATRLAAAVSAGLMAMFVAGIASAWARGLRIDCGCFGGGGELAADQSPSYGWEITRDVALLAVALYLVFRPTSRLSLDNALIPEEEDDDGDDEEEADQDSAVGSSG
jgi:uncharacterized membrane protein YphA (DoxX/SURF4 family)